MTTSHKAEEFVGRPLHGPDGRIGVVEHVFRDRQTDKPAWVMVGVAGGSRLVPIEGLSAEDDELHGPYSATAVTDSPPARDDRELAPDHEARLREHYERAPATRHDSGGARPRGEGAKAGGAAREEFGGVNWGAAFFGWLVAVGLGSILVALLGAAGTAVGLSAGPSAARSAAGTVSLVGAILLLVVLALAYYCGGYVAGRMSRFDGGRQGISVWVLGLVIALVLAIVGAVAGAQYNVLAQLNLPAVPLQRDALATGGLITLAAILVVTLLAAAGGGKAGQRYHRRVDRMARPG